MLDTNNLKRIKGILSARLGAEIPKFLNPAGPIGISNQITFSDEGFIKFKLLTGLMGNYNDLHTYITLKAQNPNATVEELASLHKPTATKIPGANPIDGDPYASTLKAAQFNELVLDHKEQAQALQQAQIAPPPASSAPAVDTSSTINKAATAPLAGLNASPASSIPAKIETPESLKSAGMKLALESHERLETDRKQAAAGAFAGQAAMTAFDVAGQYLDAKQAAIDSDTTKTIDGAYDGIASTLSNFGPWGQAAGAIMKIAGTAGDAIQELGGGTDQLTTMDKWMDSSFFSWNIGMLNGFAGKNTQDFGVDLDILASVGSSYGGTTSDLNDASEKAGKKYGLFSSKARKKADKAINSARTKLNLMGDIADSASDLRLAVLSMGELAGLAYSMMTDGGYNQKYTYAAKHGGLLEWSPVETLEWEPQIELNWELPTFKEGGNIEISEELEWIPEFKNGGDMATAATMSDWWKGTWSYLSGNKDSGLLESLYKPSKSNDPNVKYYYREGLNNDVVKNILGGSEYGKKDLFGEDLFYKDFNDVWNRLSNLGGRAERNTDNSHLGAYTIGIGEDSKGRYISYYDKFDWAPDGIKELFHPYEIYNRIYEDEFNKTQESLNGVDYKGSNPSGNWFFESGKELYNYIKNHKKGGSIKEFDIPEIEETTQKNVIPEGALHKNKHHMEHAEGLTKKGIPVIDEDGELQAEIEHSEIIFTLEVTKKLEEYYEIFYSESASNKEKEQAALEAGKLLVYLILENTEDRTGLIESCKKGGTLNFKKSTEDLIEEALEWIPTITIIEEVIEEVKEEEKPKKKSEKELMKEAIKEVLIELLTK